MGDYCVVIVFSPRKNGKRESIVVSRHLTAMFAVSAWATVASAQVAIRLMCFVVCVLTVGRVSAQVLNPGFEAAGANASLAASWTTDTATGGPVYGARTNTNPHSGSFHYEIHLASTGGGPVVQFNQSSMVVIGGAIYTYSFYSDRLTGSSGDVDEYNIQWLNSSSTVVGSTGYIGFTPGANFYAQTVVTGLTAPLAATKANVFFHGAGAAITNQSATIDFDDVSLSTTNTSGGGGGGGGGTTNQVQADIIRMEAISWFASNGVPYQVQWSSDNATWNNLGTVTTGTGSSNTVYDTFGQAGHSFYQVLSIQ